MDNNSHTNPYSAEDIRRYLEGKMSAAEMHALEKAALEDPLLADAIEGMQFSISQHGLTRTMDTLEGLKKRFNQKQSSRLVPVRTMKWWSIAAAAVVLIIGGALTLNYFFSTYFSKDQLTKKEKSTPQNQDSVKYEKSNQSDTVIDISSSTVTEKNDNRTDSKHVRRKFDQTGRSQKLQNETAQNPAATDKLKEGENLQETSPAEKSASKKDSKDAAFSPPVAAADQRSLKASIPATRNANQMQVISGRIVNSEFTPLINASLIPSNSNKSMNTDVNGIFNLVSIDSVLTIKVKAQGYQEQQFRLRNGSNLNQIVLKQATIEAALEGKAAGVERMNQQKTIPLINQNAEPEGGWNTFDQYVEKNKVYPAEESNLSGKVIVSFYVNKPGKLTNFKIEQSLAKGFNEEAIRLIKDGPAWKLLKGKRAKVKVSIDF